MYHVLICDYELNVGKDRQVIKCLSGTSRARALEINFAFNLLPVCPARVMEKNDTTL